MSKIEGGSSRHHHPRRAVRPEQVDRVHARYKGTPEQSPSGQHPEAVGAAPASDLAGTAPGSDVAGAAPGSKALGAAPTRDPIGAAASPNPVDAKPPSG